MCNIIYSTCLSKPKNANFSLVSPLPLSSYLLFFAPFPASISCSQIYHHLTQIHLISKLPTPMVVTIQNSFVISLSIRSAFPYCTAEFHLISITLVLDALKPFCVMIQFYHVMTMDHHQPNSPLQRCLFTSLLLYHLLLHFTFFALIPFLIISNVTLYMMHLLQINKIFLIIK